MARQLLIENSDFNVSFDMIQEAIESGDKKLIVKGVIQRANALNQNKRIYPKHILEREVQKYMQLVRENRAIGECDHPEKSVINLANVSHIVRELYWQGDDLMGKIEILSTPSGNILKELFKAGVAVGISSRSLGSVQEIGEGKSMVQDDLELICWDMVSNPSTQGSFVRPIFEGIDGSIEYKNESKYAKIDSVILDIFSALSFECGDKCRI